MDKKKIIGISVNDESIKNLLNTIKQNTSPAIIPVLTTFSYTQQKIDTATTQKSTRDNIINLLTNYPKYTKQDLMRTLNKADATIKEHLANLKKEGILRVGSTKSGHWEIIKKKSND